MNCDRGYTYLSVSMQRRRVIGISLDPGTGSARFFRIRKIGGSATTIPAGLAGTDVNIVDWLVSPL